MTIELDWLSRLLTVVSVTGQLEIRCAYGAPWRVAYSESAMREIPYHVILGGTAVLDDPQTKTQAVLSAGDIVLFPHGSAHVLHDGSGQPPAPGINRPGANFFFSENTGTGEHLDMLCGRFHIAPPHDHLIRNYLPKRLVVSARDATEQLASLLHLMRVEATSDRLGGFAMFNAYSTALFTLVLRAASESDLAPTGLLALAGNPRLLPAMTAMLNDPARPWTLVALAELCSMSRATFIRHFQESLGCSANELLVDLRMSMAANELKSPQANTERIAENVGYQSVAAFRRTFTQRMGMTPGAWRRLSQENLG